MISTLLVAAAFLAGSFPTGVLLARAKGVDIRAVGSGNVGATNVGRALGKKWAVLVLLVDAFKGYGPTFVADRWVPGLSPWVVAAVALASVLGHMFSLFLKGRGGKGVATSFGAALALAPAAAGAAFGLYVLLLALFRISSIGSLAGVTSFALFTWLFGARHPAHLAFAVAVAALVIVRHAENIKRLVRGKEFRA